MRAPLLSVFAPFALLSLLSLAACGGGSGSVVIDDTGGGGVGTDDTGLDDGGDDGGDEGGDDTGDDTGEQAPEPVFTFLLNGEGEDLAVDLTLTDFETGELLDRVAWAPMVDGEAGIALDEPEEEDMVNLASEGYPDTFLALYRPGLWVDEDGDGELSGDEVYSGVSPHTPFFVKGPLVDGWADIGIQEGWNVLRARSSEAEPYVMALDQVPIGQNILPRESLTLGGTVELEADDLGVTVLSAMTIFQSIYLEPLYDEPQTSASWEVALDGAPGGERIQAWEAGGLEFAYEFPLAYLDKDGSDSVSEGDEAASLACTADSLAVAAIWIPPTPEMALVVALLNAGFGFGWTAVSIDPEAGWTPLDEDQGLELSFNAGCSLD